MLSELSIIQSINPALSHEQIAQRSVLLEHFAPPTATGKQWFNTDFMLMFVETLPPKESRAVSCVPVRPHSIGGEIFLMVDSQGIPVRLEMVGGETFPKSSYAEDVDLVLAAVQRSPWDEWHRRLKKAPFLRVISLDERVVFVAATTVEVSQLVGRTPEEFTYETASLRLRKNGPESLVEGFVQRSEH
jgi:hypothetical protein